MKLIGEHNALFLTELKLFENTQGKQVTTSLSKNGIFSQQTISILNELFAFSAAESHKNGVGIDFFLNMLLTDVSESPIKDKVFTYTTNSGTLENTKFVGKTLFELMAFVASVCAKMGSPMYGFKQSSLMFTRTLGNAYCAFNMMLNNFAFYGNARAKGLHRRSRTFNNYSGIFTRNVGFIQNELGLQLSNDIINSLENKIVELKTTSIHNYLDFATYYIKKSKDGWEVDTVIVNFMDFLMYEESRVVLENEINNIDASLGLGDVLGLTDIPEATRNKGLRALAISEYLSPIENYNKSYAEFLNNIYWFDLQPIPMTKFYANYLLKDLRQGACKISFPKSNGILREMVATVSGDVFDKAIKNKDLLRALPNRELSFNTADNCLEVLDIEIGTAEKGITRNIKVNKIFECKKVDIEQIKESIVDVKVPSFIVELAIKTVIKKCYEIYNTIPMVTELFDGSVVSLDFEDVSGAMNCLSETLSKQETVFIPKAYKYILDYMKKAGYTEEKAIEWMKNIRPELNLDYYEDITYELVGLSDAEKKVLISGYAREQVLYAEYTSNEKNLEVRKIMYFTRDKDIMSNIYGEFFTKGPAGKTLKEQMDHIESVIEKFKAREISFIELGEVCDLYRLDTAGMSPEKCLIQLAKLKTYLNEKYVSTREEVYSRRDTTVVYGIYNIMYDPDNLSYATDFYCALKPENIICLKCLDTTKLARAMGIE